MQYVSYAPCLPLPGTFIHSPNGMIVPLLCAGSASHPSLPLPGSFIHGSHGSLPRLLLLLYIRPPPIDCTLLLLQGGGVHIHGGNVHFDACQIYSNTADDVSAALWP